MGCVTSSTPQSSEPVAFEVDPVVAPLLRDARHGRRPVAAVHLQLDPQDKGVLRLALGPVEAGAGLVAVGADGAVEPARGAVPAHQLAAAPRHVVLAEPLPQSAHSAYPSAHSAQSERPRASRTNPSPPAGTASRIRRTSSSAPPRTSRTGAARRPPRRAGSPAPRARRRLRTARSAPPRSGGTRPAPRCPREGTGFRSGGRTPTSPACCRGLSFSSAWVPPSSSPPRPVGAAPHRPMPRWPPNARSASGGQRGFRARQGGNAKAAPAAGGFPGCFAGARRLLPGKNLGKHRGPCRASGFRGRLPSRGSVLRGNGWWARPGGRGGDPQGPALGAGPGRREPRGLRAQAVASRHSRGIACRRGEVPCERGPPDAAMSRKRGRREGVPLGALVEYGGLEGAAWS